MTLNEIIAAHEAAAAPMPLNRPTYVLTARGHAAVAVARLVRQLRELDADDRAVIVPILAEELAELAPIVA